jgi:hypothetical protein
LKNDRRYIHGVDLTDGIRSCDMPSMSSDIFASP